MADDETATTTETWLFAGSRIGKNGARVHAWVSLSGNTNRDERWFAAHGSYVAGSQYLVEVSRRGDRVSMHGAPCYLRRHDDEALRADVEARHRAAETRLKVAAMERDDKRASALDAALEPLVKLARELRPPDRDPFLAYVIRHITKGW